jgi:hypothetical protein
MYVPKIFAIKYLDLLVRNYKIFLRIQANEAHQQKSLHQAESQGL